MEGKTLLQKFAEAVVNVENPKLDSNAEVTTKSGRKYTYKYASLGECMRVVKDACKPLGLAVFFDVYELEGQYSIQTMVSDGSDIKGFSAVPCKLDGLPQSNGSEITYAKRYSLSAAFGLVSEEDDDAQMAQNATQKKKPISTKDKRESDLREAKKRVWNCLLELYGGDKEEAEKVYSQYFKTEGFKDAVEWWNEKLTELRAYG